MATSSSSGVSGFGSSFDWRTFVSQMVAVERQPQQRVRIEQNTLNQKRDAIGSLVTALATLQQKAKALSEANLFNARSVTVTNSTQGLATATAGAKALTGNFSIEVVDSGAGNPAVGPWKGSSYVSSALTASGVPATLATRINQIDPAAAATGSLTLNGKTVSLTASSTVADVITGINGAGAGVSARFDTINGKIVLTSTTSSDIGAIARGISDYGTLLGMDTGSSTAGVPLRYKVDGGDIRSSKSPILTENETGLVGLTVTVASGKLGTIDLVSSPDTSKMKSAITEFVDAYNKAQSFISTQSAVTTASDGKVTSGVLAFDRSVSEAASKLRRMLTGVPSGAPADLQRLDVLGFTSNSDNNQLTLTDSARLESFLKSNADTVKAFFTTANTGLAKVVGDYASRLSDSTTGSLVELQTNLKKRSTALETQIDSMEKQVLLTQDRLTAGFIAMERVQAKLNQQLQYLQQRLQ